MSTSVVLLPGAPVLVPELSGAAAADTADQVARAVAALRSAASGCSLVVVLGSDPQGRTLGDVRASLGRWGVPIPVGRPGSPEAGDSQVPDSALLGWWFLDRAGIDLPRAFVGVPGEGSSPGDPVSDALVVVVADGPASLAARAPVPEDPRGVALDAALTDWVRRGGALPDPGAAVAESVGWWTRPVWGVLARLVGERAATRAESWAPFGVGYHCAQWDLPSLAAPTPGGPT